MEEWRWKGSSIGVLLVDLSGPTLMFEVGDRRLGACSETRGASSHSEPRRCLLARRGAYSDVLGCRTESQRRYYTQPKKIQRQAPRQRHNTNYHVPFIVSYCVSNMMCCFSKANDGAFRGSIRASIPLRNRSWRICPTNAWLDNRTTSLSWIAARSHSLSRSASFWPSHHKTHCSPQNSRIVAHPNRLHHVESQKLACSCLRCLFAGRCQWTAPSSPSPCEGGRSTSFEHAEWLRV